MLHALIFKRSGGNRGIEGGQEGERALNAQLGITDVFTEVSSAFLSSLSGVSSSCIPGHVFVFSNCRSFLNCKVVSFYCEGLILGLVHMRLGSPTVLEGH